MRDACRLCVWQSDTAWLICVRRKPLSQQYGIGDSWIHWPLTQQLCAQYGALCNVTSAEAWLLYSVGAPYILHERDVRALVDRWVR